MASALAPIKIQPCRCENSRFVKRQAYVQARLTTEGRQYRIGLLNGKDLLDDFDGDGLDVGAVRHLRVGHDRRRIGVDQHNLIPLLAQRLACLGPRVVEFARLPNHNRARTNDQDLVDVSTLGHVGSASRQLRHQSLLTQAIVPDADRAALSSSASSLEEVARPGEISRS